MLASSRTGLALYFTPSSSARQRAHIVRPYGWDACFMSVTHYKPTCKEWSRPFRDFVLDDLRQHRTIPALRLKHCPGSCGTASALPKCSIMSGCGTRIVLRGQKPLALCARCPCFGSLFPPLAALTFAASSIICAFGLASAVPRSPYRHLELCGIAYNKLFHITFLSGAPPMPHPGLRLIFCPFCSFPRCFLTHSP